MDNGYKHHYNCTIEFNVRAFREHGLSKKEIDKQKRNVDTAMSWTSMRPYKSKGHYRTAFPVSSQQELINSLKDNLSEFAPGITQYAKSIDVEQVGDGINLLTLLRSKTTGASDGRSKSEDEKNSVETQEKLNDDNDDGIEEFFT